MKYSLIIGTYNPKKEWLENALKSAEGLFDEIILVDDGSDIPVEEATIRHEKNKGFYEARNSGIKLAKGDWIVSLDDDDEFNQDVVKELQGYMEQKKVPEDIEIITFPVELFGEQIGLWAISPNPSQILYNNQFPSGTWFKKKVWEDLEGFQIASAEDWDFWARAIKVGKKFILFPKPVYKHRMREDSLSGQWIGKKFLSVRDDVRKNYDLWQSKEVQ